MPTRKETLVNGCYYHVFNKTYLHEPFLDGYLSKRAHISLWYANYPRKISISNYLRSSKEIQQQHLKMIEKYPPKITLLAYVFMPNHFHLLVRQNENDGLSKYVSDFQNTITQYFNKKHKCFGPLFQRQFKAVQITTQEHLLHVSRYIHLNTNTAYITRGEEELINYPFSSLGIYLGKIENEHHNIDTSIIINNFQDPDDYLKFVLDNAAHQKTLHALYKQYLDA